MTTNKKMKCVYGCIVYEDGEVRHVPQCPYYPESFSKMYDELKEKMSQPAKPNLGCAMTIELIDEIRSRIESTDYSYLKNKQE